MARPSKRKGERKEHMLRIRVTDEQKKAFEAAAVKLGADVSTFVRMAALERARKEGIDV
jgi:uncharacterized protein (DUF1778 family)